MRDFEISAEKEEGAPVDAPADIAIGSGEIVFTRLLRPGASAPTDRLKAPPAQLAFWLVDHWWRLTSECVPSAGPTPNWRLAHDLSSLGGFAWPRLSFWGEGDRIGVASRSDPAGVVGPVRYLTDALVYLPTATYAVEVEAFVALIAEDAGFSSDRAALQVAVETLARERADPDLTAWRRLEAHLGYDVDEAPDALMEALERFAHDYGTAAIAEAALATQGEQTADILADQIAEAESRHWQCDLRNAAAAASPVEKGAGDPPWRLGEIAAAAVRSAYGIGSGPVSNAQLAEVLEVKSKAFTAVSAADRRNLAYGIRLQTGRRRGEVVALASHWLSDRRFEFSRALGDAIWSAGERLGPLTRAKTERQKFQRAFAQSLLCPLDALAGYIGEDRSDGALAAAARRFMVSERLIRSVLVNKRTLERHRLGELTWLRRIEDEQRSAVSFEDVVEAA